MVTLITLAAAGSTPGGILVGMNVTVRANPDSNRYEALDEAGTVAGFVEYVDHRGKRVRLEPSEPKAVIMKNRPVDAA